MADLQEIENCHEIVVFLTSFSCIPVVRTGGENIDSNFEYGSGVCLDISQPGAEVSDVPCDTCELDADRWTE